MTTQLQAEEKIEPQIVIKTPSQLLAIPPSESEIQVQYYPYSETNGWYMHNKYRETLINKRLHECKSLAGRPMRVCNETGITPPKKAWVETSALVVSTIVGMVAGYHLGYTIAIHTSRND